jgi:hypothetical protein
MQTHLCHVDCLTWTQREKLTTYLEQKKKLKPFKGGTSCSLLKNHHARNNIMSQTSYKKNIQHAPAFVCCIQKDLMYYTFTVKVFKKYFYNLSRPVQGLTQPPIQWELGTLSQGYSCWVVKLTTHPQLVLRWTICGSIHPLPHVKLLGREADHSPSISAEDKNMWINISTPPYVFMA